MLRRKPAMLTSIQRPLPCQLSSPMISTMPPWLARFLSAVENQWQQFQLDFKDFFCPPNRLTFGNLAKACEGMTSCGVYCQWDSQTEMTFADDGIPQDKAVDFAALNHEHPRPQLVVFQVVVLESMLLAYTMSWVRGNRHNFWLWLDSVRLRNSGQVSQDPS